MAQKIHFITGKGGVGKSMVALAMAQKLASSGKRTLLVELGDHSFYEDLLDLDARGIHVRFGGVKLQDNLDVALWTGRECLREYAGHLIKVEALTKLFFENQVMRTFINIAPALPELAIMGKLTSTYRKHGPSLNYDCIVVDGYATGHFLSLMRASRGMAEAIQFGPMGEQSRSIDKSIRLAELCQYHIVTLPEELPAKEATELKRTLEQEFGVQPGIIVNKYFVNPLKDEDKKTNTKELDSFLNYVAFLSNRQAQVMKDYFADSANLQKISWCFEADPEALIKSIAREIIL